MKKPRLIAFIESPDRRSTIVRRVLIALVVVVCGVGLVLAAQHTRRGDQEVDLTGGNTTVVELLTPPDGSTLVNQQEQIGIDLTTDYDAHLVLNGTVIPDNQLERHPELNSVYFQPGPGKVFTALPTGKDTVQALVFRVDGKPVETPAITWSFNVS